MAKDYSYFADENDPTGEQNYKNIIAPRLKLMEGVRTVPYFGPNGYLLYGVGANVEVLDDFLGIPFMIRAGGVNRLATESEKKAIYSKIMSYKGSGNLSIDNGEVSQYLEANNISVDENYIGDLLYDRAVENWLKAPKKFGESTWARQPFEVKVATMDVVYAGVGNVNKLSDVTCPGKLPPV